MLISFAVITSTSFIMAALLFSGIVVLFWGLRGRRVGDTPQCRKCSYILTGLTADRCPECGSLITPKSVMIGIRHRRKPAIVAGGILTALSGGVLGLMLYGQVKNVDWYRYYPNGSLRRMASDDDLAALKELTRRMQDGDLSAASASGLMPVALKKHGSVPVRQARAWADLLALCETNGWLSEQQRDQYFRQIAPLSLKVRPQIRTSDKFVLALHREDRGSRLLPAQFKVRVDDIAVGGTSMGWGRHERWLGVGSGFSASGVFWTYRTSRSAPPGEHTVECSVTLGAFGASADPESADPIWSNTLTLNSELEVLTDDSPDPIRLVQQESLSAFLERAIRINRVTRRSRDGRPDSLSASLTLDQPAPTCLAFDVFVLSDDHELNIGSFSWSKGEKGYRFAHPRPFLYSNSPMMEIPTHVDVELRASRDAASESIDCFEAWDGVLRFGPVEIAEGKPAPPATPSVPRLLPTAPRLVSRTQFPSFSSPAQEQEFGGEGAITRWSKIAQHVRSSAVPDLVGWARWKELLDSHRPKIESASTHVEFAQNVNRLFAETKLSHLHYYTRDDYVFWLLLHLARSSNGHNKLEHVGIVPQNIDGRWFVRGLLEGSVAPSEIKVGDEIVSVDGDPFHPVLSFKGKADKPTEIKLRRSPQNSYTVRVVPVKAPLYEAWMQAAVASITQFKHDGRRIGYMHAWTMFGSEEYDKLLELQDELDGLILDFRDGFGGTMGAGSRFLLGRHSTDAQRWLKPVVILTSSEGTRSAKEIIADRARARHRATLVGMPTAGAVLPSRHLNIGADGLLALPMTWNPLEGKPVQPDHRVERDIRYCGGVDPQLDKAKEVLVELIRTSPSVPVEQVEELATAITGTLQEIHPEQLEALSSLHVQFFGHRAKRFDLDGDGALEIVLPAWQGSLHIIRSDGSAIDTIHLRDAGYRGSISAVEPVKIEGQLYWAVGLSQFSGFSDRQPSVGLYSQDGHQQWLYAPQIPKNRNAEMHLAAGDLDGDGDAEIIVGLNTYERVPSGSTRFTLMNYEGYLLVLNTDGEILCQRKVGGSIRFLDVLDAGEQKIIICGGDGKLQRFVFKKGSSDQ